MHPALFIGEKSEHYIFYTGGIDWKNIINNATKKFSNLYLYQGPKINPLFKISDILLTDFSGVTLGFSLENKPIISIDIQGYTQGKLNENNSNYWKFNELFNNGRNASHIVENLNDLKKITKYAINNPNILSSKRKKLASDLLYHPGKGTYHSLLAIKSILKNQN